MSTSYPGNLDSYSTRSNGQTIDASHINNLQDAVVAIETEVGKTSSPASGSVRYRLNTLEAGTTVRGEWEHYGLKGWNFDPAVAYTLGASASVTSGTIYVTRLVLPYAMTVTNVHTIASSAGTSVTAMYGALYSSAGSLLAQSSSIHGSYALDVLSTFVLSAPQAVSAGPVYVGFWATFSASPNWLVECNSNKGNLGLATPNFRWASANTGLTSTAPSTLGTQTNTGSKGFWVGVS